MSRRGAVLLSTCAAAALACGAAFAQQASPPATAQGPVATWLSSVLVDGRIQSGATFNPAGPVTGVNFGQLFTDKANQLVLNQFDLRAERAPDTGAGRADFGFAFEGFYGMDAQFTHFMGIGDQGSTGRNSFDLLQANLQAFVPVTHAVGVEAKAGMFVNPVGYEQLDPRANFFYSHSYIFDFGLPWKATGVLTTTHLGSGVDVYLGYDTGANASVGPGGGYDDGRPHVLAGVAARLGETTIKAFTHIGPEDAPLALPPGISPYGKLRFYNDLMVSGPLGPHLEGAAELNYVEDQGLHAHGGGAAGYLTYQVSPRLSLGARVEAWRDAEGAFVASYPGNLDYLDQEEGLPNHAFHPGPATYGEATFGLNIRPGAVPGADEVPALADSPFGQLTVRPEIRFDRVLAGASGFGSYPGSARGQVTFAVDVVVPLTFQKPGGEKENFAGSLLAESDAEQSGAGAILAAARAFREPDAAGGAPFEAIDRAQILLTNPQNVQDLDGYAPNVMLARSADGPALAPYVRGLGDAAPHTGQAPSVGLTLDGVTIDGAFAQLIDPWDLAGMAVSYGPSGLDHGREADAGAIDFTSVAPKRAWGLDAQYALEQGFHASDTRLRLDAPVGDDAGLQLTLSHRQRGGYDTNVYTGDPLYGREETTFGQARFDWSVTPQLEADLSIAAGHLDGEGVPFSVDQGLGNYQTAADQPNGESLTGQMYSLTLKDRSALGEVSSITAYVHESQSTAQDLDGGCAPSDLGGLACPVPANPLVGALDASVAQTYSQVTQELRLDHDFGGFATLRTGGFFIHDETDRAQLTRTAANDAAPAPAAGQDASARETSWAAFVGMTVHPTSRLTLEGTARFVDAQENAALFVGPGAWTGPVDPAFAQDTHSKRLLSRLAADYQLTDQVRLFADRTTGFRPGGLSLASTLSERVPGQSNFDPTDPSAQFASFGPESNTSYEAGAALRALDGRLTGRLTGYAMRVWGLQSSQVVLTPGYGPAFDTYVLNLPRVDAKGAEATLSYRPLAAPGLTLTALGGWEDARVADGLVPAAQVPVGPANVAGPAGASADLAGMPLVGAPKYNAVLRADYEHAVGPGRFLADASYAFTGSYALADLGAQGAFQNPTHVADFSFGYARSFYRLTVTARNLFNQLTYSAAEPAFFSHAFGQPRTVVVAIEANF
ncbi:MAG TPA: TonB-dependent receptor [Caulobacteraceae bacterium]|nr:TonB-dependent receptor [Caulobacteraceae bacterium]